MNILQLLSEAADLSTPEKIYKAFEKGMIPGVKKKVFFNQEAQKQWTQKHFENSLGNLADMVKRAGFTGNNFNPAFFLTLKKIGTYQSLRAAPKKIDDTDWFDALHAYFNNKNKQEVKNEPETAKKFQEFENRVFNDNNIAEDKGFERWVNEKFAGKSKVKDESKEIDKIYDKNGWQIVIPKTFAAASKYACMADKKAHWCTSASPSMFKSYTEGDNKLYIIRNDAKGIMYQMDWGVARDGSNYPNFKDENDWSAKTGEVVKNVPKDILEFLKSPKTGKSIQDMYDESKEAEKEPEPEKGKPIEGEKGWTIRRLTPTEATKYLDSRGLKFSFGSKPTDEKTLEQLMSGKSGKSGGINYIEEITNGKKTYFYVDGTVRAGRYGGRYLYDNIFEKKGDKLIAKTSAGLANLKNFPESIKKKLFKPNNLEMGKRKDPENVKPTKEIGGAKFYSFRSINQVFDVAGKPKLGEEIKRQLVKERIDGSEVAAYFEKGGSHYFFSLDGDDPFLERFGKGDYYRSKSLEFQQANFGRFAFLNKEVAKYLIELMLKNPKVKDKKALRDSIDFLDKEKAEITVDGTKFILRKDPSSYGPLMQLESPSYEKGGDYRIKFRDFDEIEIKDAGQGWKHIKTIKSPEIKKLNRIYRMFRN